ncbi:hypothetical protein LRS11_15565 [Pseudomonas sp. J452]|uniref:hypothetical protein n=1 Tax=Pseudomonas sp. J452 TaxID=2898441 RepID=UPI0021ADC828|nr:hypothetical protein [Pseudomonas sp. J452]UUY07239.1 hypothetical protein LRS11_15565 [Pseudomonas sp. J452]
MLRIDVGGLTERLSLGIQRQVARNNGEAADAEAVADGLRVSLSELGRVRSSTKNADIDESNLPDSVKELLRLIRALKQQIAEKQAELEALMAEPGLAPEIRQLRVEALRSELASLQGALSSASANLLKAMREAGLSDEQMQTAAGLALG